ncbi:TetR/AcrR family transcriptional regulator [Cytobacillus sp. IB215316]|uniref:TetR/AcrR family transcriptional regulator n=1 Tax=Cytobacillus sp. IB215316 TaxID=3097354 RepID=UPI002A1477DB|nr:TetR/AcrR family transcriptional regulator [Cytobacillus sp. IB215316]MDX8360601.1 TetR/AcrR family transcriptional regulator [Cytobacillus sp. IB215316]
MQDKEWLEELLEMGSRDEKLSPKQKKILEAAVEIFSEKGFAASSTSEIAKRAGVAEGTIFRHYKTKHDLLISIVVPTWTKIITPLLAKSFVKEVFKKNQYNQAEDFLRALLTNRLEFAKKHLPILKILLQEIPFQEELKEQFTSIFTEHIYVQLQKIIEHFQQQGDIIDLPSKTVIRMILTTGIGFILTRLFILPDAQWDDEQEIEHTIQFMLYGLSGKEDS